MQLLYVPTQYMSICILQMHYIQMDSPVCSKEKNSRNRFKRVLCIKSIFKDTRLGFETENVLNTTRHLFAHQQGTLYINGLYDRGQKRDLGFYGRALTMCLYKNSYAQMDLTVVKDVQIEKA